MVDFFKVDLPVNAGVVNTKIFASDCWPWY